MNPRCLKETVLETLFPKGCALCGYALFDETSYGLCSTCRELLIIPPAVRGRCSRCGLPLISEIETCLPCRNGPDRTIDRVIPLFPYWGKYQKILSVYKFGRRLSLGNFFAEKLWLGLDIFFDIKNNSDFGLVPVPAKPGKIKHSGWDQIEYLARLMEAGNRKRPAGQQITVHRCLKRLPSENQKMLDRKNRLQNLKGRIIVKKPAVVPKRAIIFDDVYTTGSTMDACAAALKSGGSKEVYGICLCYD